MSAWMTSDVHRSALVQEAIVRGLIPPHDADQLWQRMTFDNHLALFVRYGDQLPVDSWEDIQVRREVVEAPLNPWGILKGISCWNYQCAEFYGWDQTTAHLLMDALVDLISLELGVPRDDHPDTYFYRPEYNDAPWGINSWEQIIARRVAT